MKELVTVIYATSPHKLGDSCAMLKFSHSILKLTALKDCDSIICADGLNPNSRFNNKEDIEKYEKYLSNIKEEIPSALLKQSKEHIGLTMNYKQAWPVKTPFVLLMNHDTVLADPFLEVDLESLLKNWPEKIRSLSFPRIQHGGFCSKWWRPQDFTDMGLSNPHGEWKDCKAAFGNQDNCVIIKTDGFDESIRQFYDPANTHFLEDSIQDYLTTIKSNDIEGWNKYSGAVYIHPCSIHLDGQSKAGETYSQENERGGEGVWSSGYIDWEVFLNFQDLIKKDPLLSEYLFKLLEGSNNFHQKEFEKAFKEVFTLACHLSMSSKMASATSLTKSKKEDQSGAKLPIVDEEFPVHLYYSPYELGIEWESMKEEKKLLLKLQNESQDQQICWGGHPLGRFRANMDREDLNKSDILNVKLFDYTVNTPPYDLSLDENLDLSFCVFNESELTLSSQGSDYQNIQLHISRQDGSQIPYIEKERGLFSIKYNAFKGSPSAIGFFYFKLEDGSIAKSWTFECAPMSSTVNPAITLYNAFQSFMQESCGHKSKQIPGGMISYWENRYQLISNIIDLND